MLALILSLGSLTYPAVGVPVFNVDFQRLEEGAYCLVHVKALTAVTTEEECAAQVLADTDCGPAFAYFPAPGSLELCACPRKDGDDPHCEQRYQHGSSYAAYRFVGYAGTSLLGVGVVSNCGACTSAGSGKTCIASCRTGYVGASSTFTCSGSSFSGTISCTSSFELLENEKSCAVHVKSLNSVSYVSQCAAAIAGDSECGTAFFFVADTHCGCTRADGDDPHCEQRSSPGVAGYAVYRLIGYTGTKLLSAGVVSRCGACTAEGSTCPASCRTGYVGMPSNFICTAGSFSGDVTCLSIFGLLQDATHCTSHMKVLPKVTYVSECAAAVRGESGCGPAFSFKPSQLCECTRIAQDDPYCEQRSVGKAGTATYQLLGYSSSSPLRKEGVLHDCDVCIAATNGQTCTASCKPGYLGDSATFTCNGINFVGDITCTASWNLIETGAICNTHVKSLVPTSFLGLCAAAVLQDPDCGSAFSWYMDRVCDCPRIDGDDPHCDRRSPRANQYASYQFLGYRGSALLAEGVTSDCRACTASKQGVTCKAKCRTGYVMATSSQIVGGTATFTCPGKDSSFQGQISCSPTFQLEEAGKHCAMAFVKYLSVFKYAAECAAAVMKDAECGPGFSFTPDENCLCMRVDGDDPHCDTRVATVKPSSSYHLVGYAGSSLTKEGVMSHCGACSSLGPKWGVHGQCTASCRPGHKGEDGTFTCTSNLFQGDVSCDPTFEALEKGAVCTVHVKSLSAVSSVSACAAAVLKDPDCGSGFSFYPRQQCKCALENGDDPHCNLREKVDDALHTAHHLRGYTNTHLLRDGVVSDCGACIALTMGQQCTASCRPGYMGNEASFTCDGAKFVGSITCKPTFELIENGADCTTHGNLPHKSLPPVLYAAHCAAAVLQNAECGPAFFFSPKNGKLERRANGAAYDGICDCTRLESDDPHCNRRAPREGDYAAYHLSGYEGSTLLAEGVVSQCGTCNIFTADKICKANCRAGYIQSQGNSPDYFCHKETESFVGMDMKANGITCTFLYEVTKTGAYCNKHVKRLPAVSYVSECASAVSRDGDCGPSFSFEPFDYCYCPMIDGDDPHCLRRVFNDGKSNTYHLIGYQGSDLMKAGVQSECGACLPEFEGKKCDAACRTGYVGDSATFTCSGGVFKGSIHCTPTYVYLEEGAYCSKHVKPLAATKYSSECAASIQKDPDCGPAFSFYPRVKCECSRIDGDDPHCDRRKLTVEWVSAYHLVGHARTTLHDEGVVTSCNACIPQWAGQSCTATCKTGYYQDVAGQHVSEVQDFVCIGPPPSSPISTSATFKGAISCNSIFELLEEGASCTTPTKTLPPVNYVSQCASQVARDSDCGRAFVFREQRDCECAKADGGDPLCTRRFKHQTEASADIKEVDVMSTFQLVEDLAPSALAVMAELGQVELVPITAAPAPTTTPAPSTTRKPSNYRMPNSMDEAGSAITSDGRTTLKASDGISRPVNLAFTTTVKPDLLSTTPKKTGEAGPDPGSTDLLDLIDDDMIDKSTTGSPSIYDSRNDASTTAKLSNAAANRPATVVKQRKAAAASSARVAGCAKSVMILLFLGIQLWTE